jgi:hypothetical protein
VGLTIVLAAVVSLAGGCSRRGGENFFGSERAPKARRAWDLVHQHPWLGVGFGNYQRGALSPVSP